MPLHQRFLDRKVLYPGDILIREGDYGDSAYYIQSGQVGVYKHAGPEEILITVLPENTIVGEMALIDNNRRSATVRCLATATVIVVNRSMFDHKLGHIDPFMRALLEMFSQKIRRLNEDYCGIEQKLQWLLRQTGLPPLAMKPRWTGQPPGQTADAPPAAPPPESPRTPPKPAREADAAARAAVSELTQSGLDRFDRVKLELAMLYHPDCIGPRGDEPLTRADAFREIWGVLQRIETETGSPP